MPATPESVRVRPSLSESVRVYLSLSPPPRQCSLFSSATAPAAELPWLPAGPAGGAFDPGPARVWHCFPRPDALTRYLD